MSKFFRWLGTPIRATCALFPFTREGRQTLIYLMFALSGPAMTIVVLWAMNEALARPPLWQTFSNLSWIVGGSLLISVSGLAMFVSLRAVKLGKDGFEASGEGGDRAEGAREVAVAAIDKAVQIENQPGA